MPERDYLVDRLQRYFQHSDADHEYLTVGDRAAVCRNLRDVFSWLNAPGARGSHVDDAEFFDPDLEKQVKAFQRTWHHPIVDGKVGPNTRSRLVRALLAQFDVSVFRRLKKNEDDEPTVFISYAWADSERVDELDQWLRNHGLRVLRDREAVVAGETLNDNIRASIGRADKVIVCYSKHSSRDWLQFERAIADQVEKRINTAVLIYVDQVRALLSQLQPEFDSTKPRYMFTDRKGRQRRFASWCKAAVAEQARQCGLDRLYEIVYGQLSAYVHGSAWSLRRQIAYSRKHYDSRVALVDVATVTRTGLVVWEEWAKFCDEQVGWTLAPMLASVSSRLDVLDVKHFPELP